MRAEQISTLYSEVGKSVEKQSLNGVVDNGSVELNILNIYPDTSYQQFDFFGGAITEAVGTVLSAASQKTAYEIMNAVFSSDGLCYRAIRTHLDSCDFSTGQYCAMNDPSDVSLTSFSVKRDEEKLIPWLKEANRIAGFALPVMLTPWTPPAFMKTNDCRTGGGHLKKECYPLWANYICRYISEYRLRGINVKALSVQNEPNASQTWDSCLFTAEEEKLFVTDYLYPAFCRTGLSDIELYIWDHNRERAFDRACDTLSGVCRDLVSGVAVHWYTGDHFDALRLIHERFPEKKLIFTEGCIEYSRFDRNQLKNARRYAHDIIGNLSSGLNAFYDWNICLNSEGGPNYVGNYCESPIMLNDDGSVRYNLSYYYLCHFSRYLKPGARRTATTVYTAGIEQVAFVNPDGSIVLIALNTQSVPMEAVIRIKGMMFSTVLPADSISTIIIEP